MQQQLISHTKMTKEITNSWDNIKDPQERQRVQSFEELGFAISESLKNKPKCYRRHDKKN